GHFHIRWSEPQHDVDPESPVVAGGEFVEVRSPDFATKSQCRKWRIPVKTMASPSRSAAAITSASRTEPPGWITAVAPALAASSTPAGKGKNASEATQLSPRDAGH